MEAGNRQLQIAVEELHRNCALAPPVRELLPSSIQIWEFPLTISSIPLDSFTALLSSDERARAARFRFEKDARRFTVARATVRSILGAYTGSPARDLRFDYSHYGKPALTARISDGQTNDDRNGGRTNDHQTLNVRFSVSHSGELAILAVATRREVGVDLEAIRVEVEIDKLAERYFSEQEHATIRGLPPEQRLRAFFRCWTCKEAFLKAQGFGLSRSLGSFDVEADPDQPARLLGTRPESEEAELWYLYDIPVEQYYAAAVASEGSIAALTILRLR
jgi:4'-phosphopantetheinyl transferase